MVHFPDVSSDPENGRSDLVTKINVHLVFQVVVGSLGIVVQLFSQQVKCSQGGSNPSSTGGMLA